VLFLCLYYAAATVLTVLARVSSEEASRWVMALLTPVLVFDTEVKGMAFPAVTYAGLVLQTGMIGAMLAAISSRLQRPTRMGAAA